jgi:hypothetical protein
MRAKTLRPFAFSAASSLSDVSAAAKLLLKVVSPSIAIVVLCGV